MSITRAAIEKSRVSIVALLIVLFGGVISYIRMPQREDPGFTIRVAVVTTRLPGASPERMEELVTDPIEAVVQQIPELDFVSSTSMTGISFVYVNIKESYSNMRPIWDNLRRKIDGMREELPSGVIGPDVDDEFGDVFGIQIAMTGEGYSYSELDEVAKDVRDELLKLRDVAKVDIYGVQAERVFIEYNNARLAQLGISPGQLQNMLASQNIISPGGKVTTGRERIILEPTGNFETIEEIQRMVIALPQTGDMVYLGDIANVYRGYIDPPESKMRAGGHQCLGLGVCLRDGGSIIRLGEEVKATLRFLETQYPIGIEFDIFYFEPKEVENSVNDFLSNLIQAIVLVILVMLLFLGWRTGLVVASLIPMAMLLSFMIMNMVGITLNMISLAALIIALGLLVDNAIVVSESIMVKMEQGIPAVEAAVDSAKELRIPLLTSSLTTAVAFLPIYLADSQVGEYTADLFKVVTIALLSSWILAMTMIPLFAVAMIRVNKKKKDRSQEDVFDTRFYRGYRGMIMFMLKHRALSLIGIIIIFFASTQLTRVIPAMFFPSTDKGFIRATLEMPVGTPIEITEQIATDLEQYMVDSLLVNDDREEGLINWACWIGDKGPRYTLGADAGGRMEHVAKFIINTTTRESADNAIERMEAYLWDRYPDLKAKVKPLDYGPPVDSPIEIRLYGKDYDDLFQIVARIKHHLKGMSGTRNVEDNWGPQVKKLMVHIDQPRAKRAGVSSQDIALSLNTYLSGFQVSEFREDEDALPVIMRAEQTDREDISKLETLDVFAQASGRTVPLKQVADIQVTWQPSQILRRDRNLAVSVTSDVLPGVSEMDLVTTEILPWLEEESKNWPLGYTYELGGANEASDEANASIAAQLPLAFGLMVLLLVAQFNSFRKPLIILLTIPLALIGVFIGLAIMRGILGFMTFLGIISLAGIVINNAIVLIDRIDIERDENKLEAARAVIEAAQQRLRPILLTTATTICGLIPLYLFGGPMWESMAIAIMWGLIFATFLTLGVVPILYSLFYKVSFKKFQY